ncbi:phosphoethanolamine transferase [Helicobacter marmotae]|uniref:Phosphoethanolamine--lipid A transferase n=2 Tax=Helicobacter marmotae TaxID=152490 RepID=A0A3D8I7G4_9HELI|nr:phosphoethanolamine--lipid A transferase [Helicobacter marmotae]RDU61103.1 phosphoethanolamine--lipid A transferase [Helicobacter marmotae]
MKNLKLSWLSFTLLSAAFLSVLNFNLLCFIYASVDSSATLWQHIAFVPMVFLLLFVILCVLLVPYLSKLFMIIFILIACVSAYFMNAYGVIIDQTMLENALKTDSKEVSELLNVKFILFVLFLGILPCLFVAKVRIIYAPKGIKRALLTRILAFILGWVLLLLIFVPQTQFFVPFFRHYYQSEYYTTPFYQIKSLVKLVKSHTFIKPPLEIVAPDALMESHKDKRLLILVLGETARAANFSLFEGERASENDTNVYTRDLGVVFFNNVSSCGTSTAVSLPCMFSASTRSAYKNSEFKENALDILQKVGVKVQWFGNNSGGCQGVCKRIASVEMFNADYDGAMLRDIEAALRDSLGDEIIVVHLQGSHGPTYYKRYPDEFRLFTPTCDTNELQKCTKEQLVNTYDNTIAYSDYVIAQLIKMLEDKVGFRASLLYISDHGESLGENGIYLHAMPYFLAPKEQTHVPLLFYSNDGELMRVAKARKDYHFSHDFIFSSLLGYFDVQSKVYNPRLDIFSNDLQDGH